jgi:hypothetical protein
MMMGRDLGLLMRTFARTTSGGQAISMLAVMVMVKVVCDEVCG